MEDNMGNPAQQFKIPAELLHAFQKDIRFIPNNLPIAGYITFDRQMLLSILRSKDAAERERFVAALEKLDTKWEVVLVAPTEEVKAAAAR
jgi:hypothetical protein